MSAVDTSDFDTCRVPRQATLAAFHAGQMTPLAASSASHSLVECFGLRPCQRRPWLAVKGANVA